LPAETSSIFLLTYFYGKIKNLAFPKNHQSQPIKPMPYQNISATVSDATIQAIKDAVTTIQQ
jgi:hypothetical protein